MNQLLSYDSANHRSRSNEQINQWNDDSVNQWLSDSVIHSESANQWINHSSVTPWINDWVSERVDEPMNLWINESLIQWINAPTSQRISEYMSQWITETMNQWIKGWMNEWMDGRAAFLWWATSWLSDIFGVAPLLSATSSLRSHLAGLLLLWAASQLALL